jgi:hypothetical protein
MNGATPSILAAARYGKKLSSEGTRSPRQRRRNIRGKHMIMIAQFLTLDVPQFGKDDVNSDSRKKRRG